MFRRELGPAIFVKILNYLSDEDILQLRCVEFGLAKDIASTTPRPYRDKYDFILANTLIYRDKYSRDAAWTVYSEAINSNSTEPGVVYAKDDLDFLYNSGIFEKISRGENLRDTGRKYMVAPQDHNWDVNAAWLRGQIDKGRDIFILSDYPKSNLFHAYRKEGDFSALTKEVTLTLLAGYEIREAYYWVDRHVFRLAPYRPSSSTELYKLTYGLDYSACQETVEMFERIQKKLYNGVRAANAVNELFTDFDNKKRDIKFLREAITQVQEIWRDLNSERTIEGFLNIFNQSIINPDGDFTADVNEIKKQLLVIIHAELVMQKSQILMQCDIKALNRFGLLTNSTPSVEKTSADHDNDIHNRKGKV